MISSDVTYQAGLARIDDLRLHADHRRRAELPSRGEPPAQRAERGRRSLRAFKTLMPHRPARA
jgi:hypothetical protein